MVKKVLRRITGIQKIIYASLLLTGLWMLMILFDFLLGNPKTGGYGLTLTSSHTVVYYSNDYSLEVRLQSEDRAHRIGQTSKVTYVDLMADHTIDEKIVKALNAKIDLASQVMGEDPKKILFG